MKHFIMMFCAILILPLIFFSTGCSSSNQLDEKYVKEVNEWHKNRIDRLKAKDGWLTLVGLHWLDEGENSIGASSINKIKFPNFRAAEKIGVIKLEKDQISIEVIRGVDVFSGGQRVKKMNLESDVNGKPTILTSGSLIFYIIKRGDRYAVRVKDKRAERLQKFKGIERFPLEGKWRIEATLIPNTSGKKILVPNILGQADSADMPGELVFNYEGKQYSVQPTGKPGAKRYFLVFSDLSNGEETYGAGRFLSIKAVNKANKTIIDFNKAYNPPCAFTPYATCPLPPEENVLPFKILAGEKSYGDGHH